MRYMKQSIAKTVIIGPALSVSGATVTPITSLTIGTFDKIGLISNGTFIDLSGASFSHLTDGNYSIDLTISNLSATGQARLVARDDSQMVYFFEDFEILAANPYDAIIPGTDKLQIDLTQVNGVNQVIADFKADVSALATALSLADVYVKVAPLTFTGNDIKATLDGEEVVTDSASRTASKADVSALALEATLTARTLLAAAYFDASADEVTTDAASRTASKANVASLALEASIAALNDLSQAQSQTAADAALTAYPVATKAQMDAGHALLATTAHAIYGAPSYASGGGTFEAHAGLMLDGAPVSAATATAILYEAGDQGSAVKDLTTGTKGALDIFHWTASNVTITSGLNYILRVTFVNVGGATYTRDLDFGA